MNTTELSTFTYLSNQFRTITIEGKLWFVGMDVCYAIGLQQSSHGYAYAKLDHNESKLYPIQDGSKPVRIISESGLYRMVLRADKAEGRAFQDWVTREVLPAIRKDGGYILGKEKVATGEMDEDCKIVKCRCLRQKCQFSAQAEVFQYRL